MVSVLSTVRPPYYADFGRKKAGLKNRVIGGSAQLGSGDAYGRRKYKDIFFQKSIFLVAWVGIFWENKHPAGISFWNSIFRRAVHVQSFQSPCTCTKMRGRIFSLTLLERANQELQNDFLKESLCQKEAELWIFKVQSRYTFCDFRA